MHRSRPLAALVAALSLALVSLGAAKPPGPRRLAVAAASDLEGALDALLADYRAQHPDVAVTVTYGSSGNLARQLAEKAPFDVFLSADPDYPRQLRDKGLVSQDGPFDYAVGKLAVWVPNGSPLDLERDGLAALASPAVKKLALANPQHAPYGRAAVAALRQAGLYDKLAPRFVLGESVAQAASFVRTGAADAGLVAASLTRAPAMAKAGRAWLVPSAGLPPLVQSGVIMAAAADPEAAKALRDLLLSPAGRAVFERFGYAAPESPRARGPRGRAPGG